MRKLSVILILLAGAAHAEVCPRADEACRQSSVRASTGALYRALVEAYAANPAPVWSNRLNRAEAAWEASRDHDCLSLVPLMFDQGRVASEVASCLVSRNEARTKEMLGIARFLQSHR